MLATPSATVDPLLTSPQRIRRHDDDMAALRTLQEMPPLEDTSIQQQQQQYNTTTIDDSQEEHTDDDGDNDVDTTFHQMMNRGSYLRQLRLLALEDERERQAAAAQDIIHGSNSRVNNDGVDCEEKKEEYEESLPSSFPSDDVTSLHDVSQERMMEDKVRTLPTTNEKVLDYNSYLAHQRYYDDLKHLDIKYMDFGNIINARGDVDGGRLIVEQRKKLGKGGVCWDAAFILGEHVIAHEEEWNTESNSAGDVVGDGDGNAAASTSTSPPRIVELGAGTGLTGLMIAKATESDVVITDLPELEGLMEDNVRRNFGGERCPQDDVVVGDSDESSSVTLLTAHDRSAARGTVSSRVLRWGVEEDYLGAPYDVIVGADIVASLYDPQALARALHALSGPDTRIYISGKARLDRPHEEFDAEMERLFERVERIREPSSRLRSPDVFIIVAGGKRL